MMKKSNKIFKLCTKEVVEFMYPGIEDDLAQLHEGLYGSQKRLIRNAHELGLNKLELEKNLAQLGWEYVEAMSRLLERSSQVGIRVHDEKE